MDARRYLGPTIAVSLILGTTSAQSVSAELSAENVYDVGVAQVDITPAYPIRLNGFGGRREESAGVTQRIWAKAIAIGKDSDNPAVLLTVDSLGVRMTMVNEVAARLRKKAGIRRDRVALTFSHSHTTPKVNGASDNIFSSPIPPEHQRHIDQYTRELTDHLERVALAALADRQPARLDWAIGRVGFAKNRRTPGGPVDHDLPMLVVRTVNGKQVRAIYVSYACHCVTLSHNKISGDWAGYAQELISRRFPGAVGMVSIGAGSDSNPDSGVTGNNTEAAIAQGAQIADEVQRLMTGPLQKITGKLTTQLQTIDLPLNDLPTREQWQTMARQGGAIGYNAQTMLDRLDRGEPLMTKIDYPIQTWSFGDGLSMVFLAGEVCVDYALRLKRELNRDALWINAYSNDFCSYIPSERLVKEGGYGGGAEIPYFALPATLKAGLEQPIIDEVKRQVPRSIHVPPGTQGIPPKSPRGSLQSFRTHERLQIELVAAEPLIRDPVAIDFAANGQLWVVEMADYARPVDTVFDGRGQVKLLEDLDADGHYDKATVFLSGLRFPTDVKVWRNGVLVCDAPDIIFAADTNGDGKADERRKLFSGFATHNPHARVNSLRLGLDNWLYGSGGLFGGKITSFSNLAVDVSGRDFRLLPDSGVIEPVTGKTQQGRVRDDWGNWFGCDNGTLIRHYTSVDRYLKRNPHFAHPASAVYVPDYPDSGKLFPVGDLVRFKLSGPPGRPTSACGLEIYRDELMGEEFAGNSFVCEPVNQLVHRLVISPRGTTFSGRRAPEEQTSEFLTSTDRWFRPVQIRTGPDGALWIVDMYRYVIEHPRWIPTATLQTLDRFAGQDRGRIYRIFAKRHPPRQVKPWHKSRGRDLVTLLTSPNGTLRDLAQQTIVWQQDESCSDALRNLAKEGVRPASRLQALCTLDGLNKVTKSILIHTLSDEHPDVRRHAIRISERHWNQWPSLLARAIALADDEAPQVRLQLAYSLGESSDPRAAKALANLILSTDDNQVLAAAMTSLNGQNAISILNHGLTHPVGENNTSKLSTLVRQATARAEKKTFFEIVDAVMSSAEDGYQTWHFTSLTEVFAAAAIRYPAWHSELESRADTAFEVARQQGQTAGTSPSRLAAITLLSQGTKHRAEHLALLEETLSPRHPPAAQQAALAAMTRTADESVPNRLMRIWPTATPSMRRSILDTLLGREKWVHSLLHALEAGQVAVADVDAVRRGKLLLHSDQKIVAHATRLFNQRGSASRRSVVTAYQQAVELPGNAARGKGTFKRVCANCHRLEGEGNSVGPDLSALTIRSRTALITAILDPNRDVDTRYLNYIAHTADGQTFSGMLTAETSNSVTLVEQEGKTHILLRNNLEQLRGTQTSLMPDGLENQVTVQEMADLITYLVESGPQPKAIAGNQPTVVKADEQQRLVLSATMAEIYGKDITFEQPFKNIGLWHDHHDHVLWRFRVERSGRYDVYLDWACADESAGSKLAIDGLANELRWQVVGTGGWDQYQQVKIGQSALTAGECVMTVRPLGQLQSRALLDLRGVHLVPAGVKPAFQTDTGR